MIGIGIDTGGTCTDAVVYHIEEKQILAAAKALTTKYDLKIGIENVLRKMPEDLLKQCSQIALSTTLATNACVEDLGGKGRLILIGVNPKVFYENHKTYGFQTLDDVMLVECYITSKPEQSTEPDWEDFQEKIQKFLYGADCVSIVQLFSAAHLGSYEKKAASIIKEHFDIPVIEGNTLFPDLNAIRRGAGALLNARLVPVIYDFMKAIEDVFSSMNLELPTIIIKSDGSQMAKGYALERPVETLLCGPAASVIGALALADVEDGMIVDIGGTTTDIAIVKNYLAKRAEDGIQIGKWKTFVKGLYIDTFGLGGDTAVHYDFDGNIYLENYRVISLCSLASRYPYVLEELKELAEEERRHPYFIHEYVCFVKEPKDKENYTQKELGLLQTLKNGPLSLEKTASVLGTDVYTMNLSKLEENGLIIRAGLTPTDMMHIKGDYNEYCKEASVYAATFMSHSSNLNGSPEELADKVYELVEKKLYQNIIRILLSTECKVFKNKEQDEQIKKLIDYSYEIAKASVEGEKPFFSSVFSIVPKLVGVGAPTHVFLPQVAKLLGTEAVIPEYSSVANAVGAIASEVIATTQVEIKPMTEEDRGSFTVTSMESRRSFETYEEALEFAKEEGRRIVTSRAYQQGSDKNLNIIEELVRNESTMRFGEVWFSDVLKFTAKGSALLQ